MSNFSPLNIFKSQAKKLVRDQDVKLPVAQETLARKAGFADYHELAVVAQRNSEDPRLMMAVFGIKDFKEAIHEDDVFSELDQELEDQLSDAMAETNANGFAIGDSVVVSVNYDAATGPLRLGISIAWEGQQDLERVYYRRLFFLETDVNLIRRDGRWSLGEDGVCIITCETDADRGRRTEWEYMTHIQAAEGEEHRPSISMAQASLRYP